MSLEQHAKAIEKELYDRLPLDIVTQIKTLVIMSRLIEARTHLEASAQFSAQSSVA